MMKSREACRMQNKILTSAFLIPHSALQGL